MTDAPERIWAFYTPDDFDDDATITAYETVQHGGQQYIRADLVTPDPRVAALVGAVERLGLRDLVAAWNGEGLPKQYAPHPDRLKATIPTTCGVIYAIDAALAAWEA